MSEVTGPQVLSAPAYDGTLPVSKANYATYRKMRKDPTIAMTRWLAAAPILSSPWSYEARDDAPPDAKDWIANELEPYRLHILRTAIYGYIDYGWQSYEKVWELGNDGRIHLKKLKPLLHLLTDILVVEKTGAFIGLKNTNAQGDGVVLKLDKSLLLSFDVEGTDWYGSAMMENALNPYNEWNATNTGAKRYDKKVAGSHWVVTYPLGRTPYNGTLTDNYVIAQQLLTNLQSSGAIAVPRQSREELEDLNGDDKEAAWKIELISDSGTGQASFIERQRYLDALKVRAFGFPERAILEGEFGTKAEAEAHGALAIQNMDLRHQFVAQDINWHVINQLLRLNWGPQFENSVWISPAPIADEVRAFLQELYKAIISSPDGAMQELDNIDMEAMKDRLGVPVKEDDVVDEAFKEVDNADGDLAAA